MRFTNIMYRKKKKGVSTILGTLIFIGILFTAVVPMALVMKQADTIYEQKKLERLRLDEDRANEEVDLYVYPTGDSAPDNLTFEGYNRGVLGSTIIRIWINEDNKSVDIVVQPNSEAVIGSYDVDPQDGDTFDVKMTTARGRSFECGTGTISFEDGYWSVEALLINVLISSGGVVFKIELWLQLEDESWEMIDEAQVWKIGGTALKTFDVTARGTPKTYKVIVKRGSNPIHEEIIEMNWPEGPPIIWVYS